MAIIGLDSQHWHGSPAPGCHKLITPSAVLVYVAKLDIQLVFVDGAPHELAEVAAGEVVQSELGHCSMVATDVVAVESIRIASRLICYEEPGDTGGLSNVVTIVGNRQRKNYTAHAVAVVNAALAKAGVDVLVLHGADLDLSFPGDGPSADAKRLEETVAGADAILLATPEYHGTYSAFTKLVIESLGYPSALRGKPVALLGVAGGRLGATKSLEQLRNTCAHTGALVLPGAVSVAHAQTAFEESGACVDEEVQQSLEGLANTLLDFLHQFVQPRHVLENMIAAGLDVPWSPEREPA